MRDLAKRLMLPLRRLAGRFVLSDDSYTGTHGCIHTAASFIA